MSGNSTKDYNDFIRANLPAGMIYNGDVDRYQVNDHSFFTYKRSDWYYRYISKFGYLPIPASLFANGEQGAWYDPADLSTLFQGSAGTTPVTTAGQPVGKMLDESGRGNHATQATSAARPTYAVVPFGGRRNLFEYSQDFTNAAWAKQRVTIGAAVTAPDGSADALPFVETTGTGEHNAFETVTGALTSGEPTTFSTFYKYVDRPFANVRVFLTGSWTNTFFNVQTGVVVSTGAGLTSAIEDFGGGWYRCSVTVLSASSTGNASVTVGMSADGTSAGYTGDGTSSILIYGAQIEPSATATAYQKVATQYDVTEAGVQTRHYLASDGVDDALNWTATADDYTIARVNSSGTVTIQTTQALSGATDIFAAEDDIAGYVAVNRALTTAETSGLTAYLEGLAT
jgi:hypothetical protein